MNFVSFHSLTRKRKSFALALAATTIVVGCAPLKNKQNSIAKEFENSANICGDINNFATLKSKSSVDQDAPSLFASKKLSERRILIDLIGQYQGVLTKLSSPVAKPTTEPDKNSVAVLQQSMQQSLPQSSSTSSNTQSNLNGQGNPKNSDGSKAGCGPFAGMRTYTGIPPHPVQVQDAETAKQIVAKYCSQLQAIDSPSCAYTAPKPANDHGTKGTALCANMTGQKPNWINDQCEVITTASLGSLNKFAGESCKIIGKAVTSANPAGCAADIITGVCAAHAKGAGDAIQYFNSVSPSDEQLNQQTIDTITGAFYKTALSCVRSIGTTTLNAAIKADPGSSAAYWAGKVLGKEYVKNVLTNYKPNVVVGVAKEVAFAACSAAANSLANQISAVPPTSYSNDCGPRTPEEDQARVASCFRTSASSCDAFAGNVDFAKIVGAKSGAFKLTADIFSTIVKTGCSVGGEGSKLACGVISESTKQIIEAARTGNNSWADCAGTTKIGQCIGSRLGSAGWTNNNGVSEPTGTGDNMQRDCCWCVRTWYENDWGSDTAYKQENWVGVIQQGDFKTGNCVRPGGYAEGSKWWDASEKRPSGYDAYYSYGQCKKVTLRGDSCVLGAEYYQNGKPSGYVIRKESWKP